MIHFQSIQLGSCLEPRLVSPERFHASKSKCFWSKYPRATGTLILKSLLQQINEGDALHQQAVPHQLLRKHP
jgi:hypothetical protein